MTATGQEFEPIGSYGMLSDCSSAALVSNTGSIDWLCNFPQAFSHVGLITAAWEIDRARERLADGRAGAQSA